MNNHEQAESGVAQLSTIAEKSLNNLPVGENSRPPIGLPTARLGIRGEKRKVEAGKAGEPDSKGLIAGSRATDPRHSSLPRNRDKSCRLRTFGELPGAPGRFRGTRMCHSRVSRFIIAFSVAISHPCGTIQAPGSAFRVLCSVVTALRRHSLLLNSRACSSRKFALR